MKRTIVCFLIMFFLIACGSSSEDDNSSSTTSGTDSEETPTTPTYNLSIKGSINKMEDFSGNVRYLGEVQNTGTAKACFVKITFTSYDANDSVIDTDYSYIHGMQYIGTGGSGYDHVLGENQFGSFEVISFADYDSVSKYSYKIAYSTYSVSASSVSLSLSGSVSETTDSSGNRGYLGEIKNDGGGTASFVKIYFVMKNASNLVINTDFGYINGDTCTTTSGTTTDTCLTIGNKGSFEVDTLTSASDINSYYYRIYHDEYEVSSNLSGRYRSMGFEQLTRDQQIMERNRLIDLQLKKMKSK